MTTYYVCPQCTHRNISESPYASIIECVRCGYYIEKAECEKLKEDVGIWDEDDFFDPHENY